MSAARRRLTQVLPAFLTFLLAASLAAEAGGPAAAATEAEASRTDHLRPTGQELRSPAWWIDQAMREAGRIEDPKLRAGQLWNVGVTAFNAGRFDVTRRVMAMDLLDRQQHETLAYRLAHAFEQAGDLARLDGLAKATRRGFQREQILAALTKLQAARGDLDGAERRVAEDVPAGRRGTMYASLSARCVKLGQWDRAWALAERSFEDELVHRSSTAAHALLAYAEAAADAGRNADVLRAAGPMAEFAEEWADHDVTAADLQLDDLAALLRRAGHVERAAEVEAILPPGPAPEPEDPDHDAAYEAVALAEAGKFAEAARRAEAVRSARERAHTLATIVTLQAPADCPAAGKLFASAKAAFDDSLKADGEELDDPDLVYAVALAAAAVGEFEACWAALATAEDPARRESELLRVAGDRADAGDVAFTRAAMDRSQGSPRDRDRLAMRHAIACAKAGDLAAAAAVAETIADAESAFIAYRNLAVARDAAGDPAGFDDAVRRARQAMERTGDHLQWGWSLQSQLARTQARTGRARDVWESVLREPDPAHRVVLMDAACDGLLARLNPDHPGG
jgi:hypothetical protein